MRALALLAVAGVVTTGASLVHAQETGAPFGARAQNIIVIDEIAGFYRETVSYPDRSSGGGEQGYVTLGSHEGAFAINETTRFGYHRMIGSTLSIGGGIHFVSRDVSFELGSGKETTLGISPRIGFVFGESTSSAFWLRAGFQYYHHSSGDNVSAWDLGPGAELFYVITPFEHFGITIGPTVEMQLAGSQTSNSQACGSTGCTTVSRDEAVRHYTFGLALGFLFDL